MGDSCDDKYMLIERANYSHVYPGTSQLISKSKYTGNTSVVGTIEDLISKKLLYKGPEIHINTGFHTTDTSIRNMVGVNQGGWSRQTKKSRKPKRRNSRSNRTLNKSKK